METQLSRVITSTEYSSLFSSFVVSKYLILLDNFQLLFEGKNPKYTVEG
jgi:hypothetical protein